MLRRLNERMERYAERQLAAMSEVERRDARAFDEWFVRRRGWRWLVWVCAGATLLAAAAAELPWNLRFLPAAVMFNGIAFALLWAAFVAWFGYRRLQGKLLRVTGFCLLTVQLARAAGARGRTALPLPGSPCLHCGACARTQR